MMMIRAMTRRKMAVAMNDAAEDGDEHVDAVNCGRMMMVMLHDGADADADDDDGDNDDGDANGGEDEHDDAGGEDDGGDNECGCG